jgi:hypothetical protein
VLHLPRNPVRQATFGEAGLEVRLVRELKAIITWPDVHPTLLQHLAPGTGNSKRRTR